MKLTMSYDCLPSGCCRFSDVAIIGNGPSAIALSYFLSGNRPYYNGKPHPNPILNERLRQLDPKVSLVDQELEFLCEGLEGRSSNPVAVLFDALMHPDADFGTEQPSVLDWRLEREHAVDHVALGKLRPGGAWQQMDGSMQTLSLSSWMELPDLPFQDWLSKNKRVDEPVEPCVNRATITDVCNYYTSFVEEKDLRNNFLDYHTVTSIQKVYKNKKKIDDESGESEPCCPNMKKHPFFWEIRGYRMVTDPCGAGVEQEVSREDFCILSFNVVIATGTFDIPNKLGVAGENLPYVSHSLHNFESVINNKQLSMTDDPVLVVGAGLSAADAILMALQCQIPVAHTFRRGANDSSQVLKKLPQNMYPEYHQVHSLMMGTIQSPLYRPLPNRDIAELKNDRKALLQLRKKDTDDLLTLSVSHAVILIGARPDLSFLPQGGRDLGVMRRYPIESKHNPIDIDPYSYQSVQEAGLYSIGPLVGDNFVRFAIGGAFGITNHFAKSKVKNM